MLTRLLICLSLLSAFLFAGCARVDEPVQAADGQRTPNVSTQISMWHKQARSIETQGIELGSINKPAANALCRELMYALTPQTWLVLSRDAGGKYSSTLEVWVVLDAWRRMRCHGGALAQPLD